MTLPRYKTKIVCTIGPVSRSESVLKALLKRGMNVARLNFSHGTFEEHREDIRRIRSVAGDVISLNVIDATHTLPIRYILTPTQSGNTPRWISRFKPECWILSFTNHQKTHEFLALSYGVHSVLMEETDESRHEAIMAFIKDAGFAKKGDNVIITAGVSLGQTGWTNSLRILSLHD
jgi:pyruvate kinase